MTNQDNNAVTAQQDLALTELMNIYFPHNEYTDRDGFVNCEENCVRCISESDIKEMSNNYADLRLSQSSATIEGLKEELDKYREALTDRNNKVAKWKGQFELEHERSKKLVEAMRLALGYPEEREEGKYWQLIIDIEAIVEHQTSNTK